jgi:hypothetical protein
MDCVEGAKQYIADKSVDLLIADPPFSIDEKRLARFYTKYPDRVIPGYVLGCLKMPCRGHLECPGFGPR